MGDTEGRFRITYTAIRKDDSTLLTEFTPVTLDFGSVTDIKPTITKAVSTIPLVSMGADRAFQLETGSTLEYNISFSRLNPSNPDDTSEESTNWSNAYWYEQVTKLTDRWQMRTDGCKLTYKPSITNPYVPSIDVNGYIKMLTRTYNNKFNELITGTIQFIVGTMYVLSSPLKKEPEQKKYKVLILDPNTTSNEFPLDKVYFMIEDGASKFLPPTTPPEWLRYSLAKNKHVEKWSAYVNGHAIETYPVSGMSTFNGTAKNQNPLVLKASWKSGSS